jgi:hypothetical protein
MGSQPNKETGSCAYEVLEREVDSWRCWGGPFSTLEEARTFADQIDNKREWAVIMDANDDTNTAIPRVPSSNTGEKA